MCVWLLNKKRKPPDCRGKAGALVIFRTKEQKSRVDQKASYLKNCCCCITHRLSFSHLSEVCV